MKINIYKNSLWSSNTSKLIAGYLKNLKLKKINILLTGGKTASKLYNYFFPILIKINKSFSTYLSDERCVDYNNINSNFHLVSKKINNFKNSNISIFSILNKDKNYLKATNDYKKKIPKKIDLLLLSVGKDGHVASIFERDKKIHNTKQKVVFIKKKYNKFPRITITWETIKLAKKIFILCKGYGRGKILFLSIMKKNHILNKICLLKSKTELCFDKSAYLSFSKTSQKLLILKKI